MKRIEEFIKKKEIKISKKEREKIIEALEVLLKERRYSALCDSLLKSGLDVFLIGYTLGMVKSTVDAFMTIGIPPDVSVKMLIKGLKELNKEKQDDYSYI